MVLSPSRNSQQGFFLKTNIFTYQMLPGNRQYRYTDLYFTTATVKGWKHLLRPDKYKNIITDSLGYLLKFVAQQIKFDLIDHHPLVLERFRVARKDRQYQFLCPCRYAAAIFDTFLVWRGLAAAD